MNLDVGRVLILAQPRPTARAANGVRAAAPLGAGKQQGAGAPRKRSAATVATRLREGAGKRGLSGAGPCGGVGTAGHARGPGS